jgi:hypothetical protein
MVAEEDVGFADELAQDRFGVGVPALPQLRAIVAVERDFHPTRARRFRCRECSAGGVRTERRRNPRQVEQLRIVEEAIPVEGLFAR